ncbi:MAG: hypothetical protein HUU49_03480 [Candidatus Buchananbacteria bacterium]|nr:hypothetical protein [Candidatus Buchananbacteria bacterium]
MNGFYVVTSLALAGMIVCAYSRLVGTKSNVIFHAMVISTIMMASAALSIHTLDVISQSDTSRGMVAKEFKATVDAWAYQLTNFLRSGYLAEYVVTQEGDLDVNGNLVKLTKGTKVYRDLSAKPDYPDGLPPRYKVTVNGGTNDGMKGFFSSSLLKPAKKPSEPKVVQPAPAPALTPATTVTLSSPPALTPPVSANPLESEITAETGEWEDIAPSSLIPQAGDMLVWGPLDNPKEFRRLEFIVGLNADDVSTPVVFDYPGGGFVGKTGVTKNDSNSPLRFRVTDGEPITFKVKVEPGEYARYLKRKGD